MCFTARSPRHTVGCSPLSACCVQLTLRCAANARVVRRTVAGDRAGAVAASSAEFAAGGVESAARIRAFAAGASERGVHSCADVARVSKRVVRPERTVRAAGMPLRAPPLMVRDSPLKAAAAASPARTARRMVRNRESMRSAAAFCLHAAPMACLSPSLPVDTPMPLLKGEKKGVSARARANSRRHGEFHAFER